MEVRVFSTAPSFLIFLCLLGIWPACAFGAENDRLAAIEKELSAGKSKAESLSANEKSVAHTVETLQDKLVAATKILQNKQQEQDRLEEKLSLLEKESAARSAALAASREKLARMTTIFLRFARLPPEAFLLHEDLSADHSRRALLFRALIPQMQAETKRLSHELSELDEMRQKTAEQKSLLDELRTNLEKQRANLNDMINTRQKLLKETTAQREAMSKKMAALSAEAGDLRQLVEKLNSPGYSKLPRPNLKNGLISPVAGRQVKGYGAKDEYGVASEGLTLTAPRNSPIIAPASGRVVFAGPFKGYGRVMILEHGGGFHSFLAGFGTVEAQVGQKVKAGEPIGTLPDKDNPELYFEWRHNNEPQNPANDVTHTRTKTNPKHDEDE